MASPEIKTDREHLKKAVDEINESMGTHLDTWGRWQTTLLQNG